jgi:hypothetical protein
MIGRTKTDKYYKNLSEEHAAFILKVENGGRTFHTDGDTNHQTTWRNSAKYKEHNDRCDNIKCHI